MVTMTANICPRFHGHEETRIVSMPIFLGSEAQKTLVQIMALCHYQSKNAVAFGEIDHVI
jgi:hypothetical protein